MNMNTNTIIWAQLFEYLNNPNIRGNTGAVHYCYNMTSSVSGRLNILNPSKSLLRLLIMNSSRTD